MDLSRLNNDVIAVTDLLVRCIIGINDEERINKQDVLINIEMSGDFKKSAISDSIDDALNYKSITKKIIRFVESSSFQLIETMAERIAGLCLEDIHCRSVKVRVEKPGALRFTRNVGVSIERERKSQTFIVGISGNISPLIYLPAAIRKLYDTAGIRISDTSPVYITTPEKQKNQSPYRNGAIALETEMPKSELNSLLKAVESDCGRTRGSDPYESRTVDLDILVENGRVIHEDVKSRWYLQALISGLTGIVPSELSSIPENPEIDTVLTEIFRNF